MSAVQNQFPALTQRDVRTSQTAKITACGGILLTLLAWSWWPFVRTATANWSEASQSGAGLSLLMLGLTLVVSRRHAQRAAVQFDGTGIPVVMGAILTRFIGTAVGIEFVEGVSLLMAVAGIAVLCAGRANVSWFLPPILFLSFLLPWPYGISHAIAEPLQHATIGTAAYIVQLCGYPAVTSGELLLVNDATVDITRQVGGLGSLIPFVALASGLAMLITAQWWQRLLLVASAVPVGILLLGTHAAAEAILTTANSALLPTVVAHGSWFLMGLALLMFLAELWLLANLFLETESVSLTHDGVGPVQRTETSVATTIVPTSRVSEGQ